MLWIWASIPMGSRVVGGDCDGVHTADPINADWYRLADAAAPPIATRRRLREIQGDARAGSLSRSRRSTSPRPCTTLPPPSRPVHARRQARPEPLIAAHASARRSDRDSEPPSAASRALDPGASPRGDWL